jgi:hypothetical protein
MLPFSKSNKILSMLNCQLLYVGFVAISQLKLTQVFHTSRINLSPFTKDFRVWGTPIEIHTYFSVGPLNEDLIMTQTVNIS